jgi:riboflavin kinase/FMN adenylyltransferase
LRVPASVLQQRKMTFIRDPDKFSLGGRKSVVTIGSFDGVHLGHQAILEQVIGKANELKATSVAMTFEPQPQEYFSAEKAPARLMRLRDKIEALMELGVDQVVCLQFNSKLRNYTAEQFVTSLLVKGLGVKQLIVGDDFRFGCDRSGNFEMLVEMGRVLDFNVQDTQTIEVDGERVSSTLIRRVLEQADFSRARQLLGRAFAIKGRVFYGQQLGRTLGFPTANIQLNRYRAPLSGVYAVSVEIDGLSGKFQGAANVGVRPTVGDLLKPILEVHLLDFDRDIYGKRINVEFLHKVRDEQKFTTMDNLVTYIQQDVKKIKQWFAEKNSSAAEKI